MNYNFQVMITQKSWQSDSWYNSRMGEIFIVFERDDIYSPMDESYCVIENGLLTTMLINKSDCKKLN